jgi:hypothetical protein
MLCERIEVGIGREHPHPVAHGHGANQQVGGSALDAFTAAEIVEAGGVLVIFLVEWEIG